MTSAANQVNTANFKPEQKQEQEQKHFETVSPFKNKNTQPQNSLPGSFKRV